MKNRLPIFILLALAILFAVGLLHLVELRYDVGDIYPEYSSLRSDPLGTMALYESLEQLPGISVRRDFSSDNHLPEEKDAAYLHLAAPRGEWTDMQEETVHEIEGYLTRGGRLVITFLPETAASLGAVSRPVPPSVRRQSARAKAEEDRRLGRTSLTHRWGFEFGHHLLTTTGGEEGRTDWATNQTELSLPPRLIWHSAMVFTNLDSGWTVIYSRMDNPVVVERRFGPGSVVMSTDCYYQSNEALRQDRHADLLAWLIGPGKHIYFDEGHLGILETPGVTTLMRRYHLGGLGLGILGLALLFVWKNSMSFVPPYAEEESWLPVQGREAAAGFVNLLRRNIPSRDLLQVCFDQWTRSLVHSGHQSIAQIDEAQAVYERENKRAKVERNPVRAYREICDALRHRKSSTPAAGNVPAPPSPVSTDLPNQ
jgi:hypothetical protein